MLVLSRKAGESIVFPGLGITVKVTALDYSRGRVKLGITAPDDVNVVRDEIIRETVHINTENNDAGRKPPRSET